MVIKRHGRGQNSERAQGLLGGMQNRLILFMSTFDIINSTALAFSTLPSPKESPFCDEEIAVGNQTSCTIQGAMITVGAQSYNAMLCLYYFCILQRNMEEKAISSRYEAVMHAYAIIPAIVFAIFTAIYSIYDSNGSFCFVTYEWDVEYHTDEELEENKVAIKIRRAVQMSTLFQISSNAIIIAYSMISIICCFGFRSSIRSTRRRRPSSQDMMRATRLQALIYVGGYFITYTWAVAGMIWLVFFNTSVPISIRVMGSIFSPAQGVWNLIGFIRPRFKRVSDLYPDRSMLRKLLHIIFNKDIDSEEEERGERRLRGVSSRMMRGRTVVLRESSIGSMGVVEGAGVSSARRSSDVISRSDDEETSHHDDDITSASMIGSNGGNLTQQVTFPVNLESGSKPNDEETVQDGEERVQKRHNDDNDAVDDIVVDDDVEDHVTNIAA